MNIILQGQCGQCLVGLQGRDYNLGIQSVLNNTQPNDLMY